MLEQADVFFTPKYSSHLISLLSIDNTIPKLYTQRVIVKNTMTCSVDVVFRPSSPERLEVRPNQLHLAPGQTAKLVVRLRVLRFANLRLGQQGKRDNIRISSDIFEQNLPTTFYLSSNDTKSAEKKTVGMSEEQNKREVKVTESGEEMGKAIKNSELEEKNKGDEPRQSANLFMENEQLRAQIEAMHQRIKELERENEFMSITHVKKKKKR